MDYDRVVTVYLCDIEDYNRITKKNESVPSGKILLGVDCNFQAGDELTIGNKTFGIEKKIDLNDGGFNKCLGSMPVTTLVLIADDMNEAASYYKDLKDTRNSTMLFWTWKYYFDTDFDPSV